MLKAVWNRIQHFLSENTLIQTVGQGNTVYEFTESPKEQTQECNMFKIEDSPKPPSKESLLRIEVMETMTALKAGQHFDVPYDYEGLGKVRVVSCVNNYVSQFRIGQGKNCPFTYKVINCKKEKGGYSRVSMHKADDQ